MTEKMRPGAQLPYGEVNPLTDTERVLGQEARGEIDTSVEAVRAVAAAMDEFGGTGVLGKGKK